jgi:hypothetical protein
MSSIIRFVGHLMHRMLRRIGRDVSALALGGLQARLRLLLVTSVSRILCGCGRSSTENEDQRTEHE